MSNKRGISRRQFLKRAMGIAAGVIGFPYVVPSSALGKAGTIAPSNRITMGFIGMGGQGTKNMQGFMHKDEVQVLAVCDVIKAGTGFDMGWRYGREPAGRIVEAYYAERTISGKYKKCACYNDFRELIARDDIDAMMIATPDHWHGIMGVMAVRAGKDVFCEKPLAYNIAEGQAICDAVKKYGAVWQTGSQQRSDAKFRRACELVRNGRIGKVHTVRVGLGYGYVPYGGPELRPAPVPEGFDYDMWIGPAPSAPYSQGRCIKRWRWISDYSGGQITDWAGHHCDIAQWGMGTELSSPVEIEGKGQFPREGLLYDAIIGYQFRCKYDEGFTLIVSDASRQPKSKDGIRFTEGYKKGLGVLFEGTDGWVQVNRGGLDAYPESVLDSVIGPDEIHLYKSDDHRQNFLDCVKRRCEPVAPAEVAHHSIMIGHLGLIAMKLGRKLCWDPAKEQLVGDAEADRLLTRPMRSPWHL